MGVREYAEETLGVHRVWEATEQLLNERKNLCAELDRKRREFGGYKQQTSEREMEVINEQSTFEHGSATARKEAIKEAIAQDKMLHAIRVNLDEVRADLDSIEDDLKTCDLTIQANTARMEELGELMRLYAVTKQAG